MRGPLLALGLTMLGAGSAASAENWRVSSSGGEAVGYVDVDSIRRDGDTVTFWREVR
jgi:hypothetical protein